MFVVISHRNIASITVKQVDRSLNALRNPLHNLLGRMTDDTQVIDNLRIDEIVLQ